MNNMNPEVDWYFSNDLKWREEIGYMRKIVIECGLTEELKWGCPCYTLQKSNVVLIHVFKEYCAFLFFKGALMSNHDGILVQQTKNVQAARQIRFTNVGEIIQLEVSLKTHIYEAIEIEKAGLKVNLKKTSEFSVPDEFQNKLSEIPELKTAFENLTPGRQRAYIFHFSQPKLSKTRESRIEKNITNILNGKGLDD